MIRRTALEAHLVHDWVRLYTTGLSPEVRDARRAEIDSDLWEHMQEAARMGLPTSGVTPQILLRWLTGIPADLTWRLEQRNTKRQTSGATERRPSMNSSRVSKVFLGVAVVLTLMYPLFAGISSADPLYPDDGGSFVWIGFISIATLAVLSGLFISGWRWPIAGGVLVALGAILMVVMVFWFPPMWIPALVVAAIGIIRARKFAQARRLPS